jgi:hypothetical protein
MIHEDENSKWADSLDDFKPDFYPIKCTSLLQFFNLRPRATTVSKDNLLPAPFLHFCVIGSDNKYYFHLRYHMYSVDELYFYRRAESFSGDDAGIESLRNYVTDGNLILLYTLDQIKDLGEQMRRLIKGKFKEPPEIELNRFRPIYLQILELSLKLEDYKDIGKNLTGFKTTVNIMETQIRELWQKAVPKI